jgi:hypothetical protein
MTGGEVLVGRYSCSQEHRIWHVTLLQGTNNYDAITVGGLLTKVWYVWRAAGLSVYQASDRQT